MKSKGRRIAIIVPREQEYSGRLVEGGLAYAAEHRAVRVDELSYPVDDPDFLTIPDHFPFDAAVVWAIPEARWLDSLLEQAIPLVSASGDIAPGVIPCVAFAHQPLVDAAVNHLARCHPSCLVYLQFVTTGIPLNERRWQYFQEAALRHGLPCRSEEIFLLGSEEFNAQSRSRLPGSKGGKRLTAILKNLPSPSAIWCGDDGLAQGVCEAATELGLRIPQDLAVLGLGNFRSAEAGGHEISTIPLPGDIIGYRALSLLDQKLSGRTDFPNYLPVEAPPVLVRETTLARAAGDPVSRALALIAERACSNLSVREVAETVSLSPQSLNRRFIEQMGHSPGEEIRRVKLARAKSCLRDPRLTVAEIASRVGYGEQNKFSNFFKRKTGMSPSQWRTKNG